MAAVPTPVRASVRDLLGDLVGKPVAVTQAAVPQELATERPAYAATYRFDDGRVAAMAVCDLTAASSMGAAIGFMGKAEAEAEIEQHGELQGDLSEFFHEVVNVLAKLLNSPTSPHVALREVDKVPGQVRSDAARLALQPTARVDLGITIEGFNEGLLTIITD
jgi:hypothetical protein